MSEEHEYISSEDLKTVKACLMFGQLFAQYIRERDAELWHRAREFALDYTEVEGVSFIDVLKK